MKNELIFDFKTPLTGINISDKINNPFGLDIPEIGKIAAKEFQEFIQLESRNWKHDFSTQKGKMFGILVVQKENKNYGYLGAISGKIPNDATRNKFVPSIFDDSADDFFINKGMTALTEIGLKIKEAQIESDIILLTEKRRQKSLEIQQQLFENYRFLNHLGAEKNVLEIFKNSTQGYPPSAAGECAAPKLLHYAFKNKLKPIALAEFWWGKPLKNIDKEHKTFYPACKNKCRPILEYMLNNIELYNQANTNN